MRITFLLPGRPRAHIGGCDVLYRYADGLARNGHRVTVVHTPFVTPFDGPRRRLRSLFSYCAGAVGVIDRHPRRFFPVSRAVRFLWLPAPHAALLPAADCLVYSFWTSAATARRFPARVGRPVYLVQEYEHFQSASPEQRRVMMANFRAGADLLAISPAVSSMLVELGANVFAYLPNGINLDQYQLQVPIDDSGRSAIGFPYRVESFKRTPDAVAALALVREQWREPLHVWSFGTALADDLPPWTRFHHAPDNDTLAQLYNQSAAFVVPSESEGWGLPGSEAMACGAALASTDNGGVRAYAEHGVNALLSAPRRPDLLAANILELLRRPERRFELARAGHKKVQQFTWAAATRRLEACLAEVVKRPGHTPLGDRPGIPARN